MIGIHTSLVLTTCGLAGGYQRFRGTPFPSSGQRLVVWEHSQLMQAWSYGCGHSEADGHITNAEHLTTEKLFTGSSQP
jgi:hypothetical protein